MRRFSIGELVYYKREIGIVQGYFSQGDKTNPRFKVHFGSGQSLLIKSDELRKL